MNMNQDHNGSGRTRRIADRCRISFWANKSRGIGPGCGGEHGLDCRMRVVSFDVTSNKGPAGGDRALCRGMNRMIDVTFAQDFRGSKRFYVSLPFMTNSLQAAPAGSCLAMQRGHDCSVKPAFRTGGYEFSSCTHRLHSSAMRRLRTERALRAAGSGGHGSARSQKFRSLSRMPQGNGVAVFSSDLQNRAARSRQVLKHPAQEFCTRI